MYAVANSPVATSADALCFFPTSQTNSRQRDGPTGQRRMCWSNIQHRLYSMIPASSLLFSDYASLSAFVTPNAILGNGSINRGLSGRAGGQCPEFLALKHESRILGHASNPASGFSMMEQVRLSAVWPMENWLGFSLHQIQG